MFDLTKAAEQEMLAKMRDYVNNPGRGFITYGLVTRIDDELMLHRRDNQPCYGELRKYWKSHRDEYTDPEPHDEYRPSDLRSPFPKGRPEGLILNLSEQPNPVTNTPEEIVELFAIKDEFMRYLFSEESPWRRGIPVGMVEFVEGTTTMKCSPPEYSVKDERGFPNYKLLGKSPIEVNHVKGVIFRDLAVDPTVMVNLFNVTRHIMTNLGTLRMLKCLLDEGASKLEASALMITVHTAYEHDADYLLEPNSLVGYYTPVNLDWDRFRNGDARDLTGGLLSDRYDYNRKRLHEIFETELLDFSKGHPKHAFDRIGGGQPSTIQKYRTAMEELNVDVSGNLLRIFRHAFNHNSEAKAA